MNGTLTIKVKETPTGQLRFVFQESDKRYVLQQEWRIINTNGLIDGQTTWRSIPVINSKDVPNYKSLKLMVAKKGKVEIE